MKPKKIIKSFFCLIMLWFIGHSIFIITDGLSCNNNKADIALILGTTVNEDGTLSERLKNRLDCGLKLYKTKKIIVSGGLGKEGYFEGDIMKQYLIHQGVPDTSIIIDNNGNNTRLSVLNTIKLKDSLHFNSVTVVSQYFHVSRAKMLFKKHHFININSCSPSYFEYRDVYSIVREFFAYYSQ